jgi:hypothetical protein
MKNSWDRIPEEEPIEPESLDAAPKRGRGRPKGSTTKVPESSLTLDKMRQLYARVKPFLSEEQKRYTEGVIEGSVDVDPMLEMRMLVRQMSLIFSEAAVWHLMEGKVSRDFASFANNFRMAITDLAALDEKERIRTEKSKTSNDMVRLTEQGAEMGRYDEVLRRISDETGTG